MEEKKKIEIILEYAGTILKKNPDIDKKNLKIKLQDEFGENSKKIVKVVINTLYSRENFSLKKISKVLRKVNKKINKWGNEHIPGPIKPIHARLLVLLDILADSLDGSYDIGKGAIASIVSALIYLLLPLDLIPDFLPIAGFLDDAGIICVVFFALEKLIKTYCVETGVDVNALNMGEYKKISE